MHYDFNYNYLQLLISTYMHKINFKEAKLAKNTDK